MVKMIGTGSVCTSCKAAVTNNSKFFNDTDEDGGVKENMQKGRGTCLRLEKGVYNAAAVFVPPDNGHNLWRNMSLVRSGLFEMLH